MARIGTPSRGRTVPNEQIEHQPTFNERLVESHEEIAEPATYVMLATGVMAAIALWRGRKQGDQAGVLPRLVLAGLLASTGLFAVSAWTGGPISHLELRGGPASAVDRTPMPGDD